MIERKVDYRLTRIGPGELFAAEEPTEVVTLLGSCVAVTMFCSNLGIGAICHATLPSGPRGKFKYVDSSILWMVQWFDDHNQKRKQIETKIFGGGEVLSSVRWKKNRLSIGRMNINMALETIRKEGLNLVTGHVGGGSGREIVFNTKTGDVLMSWNGKMIYPA